MTTLMTGLGGRIVAWYWCLESKRALLIVPSATLESI